MKAQEYGELNQVEILQVGALPERGVGFTKTDLQEIADNTNQLIREGLHNPPGKLGHDDDQAFARESGLPATGWVESLHVVGDKLIARMKEVPSILMKAFREKLYRKISSEVYFDFAHPKTHKPMGKVLRAVAFLGADIPQVKGLADFLGEQRLAYSFAEGDHSKMAEMTINITLPDPAAAPESPATPVAPSPGPITSEGLAGRELELYRQGEMVAAQLRLMAQPEFAQEASVENLLRYVGRLGAVACSGSPEFRQRSDNPEELCAWLEARARERGYVATPLAAEDALKENAMDTKKMEELSAQLAEATSARASSEQEAVKLKEQVAGLSAQIAAERKKQDDAKVNAFVEAHKDTITPAVEPAFRALCENAGDGEVEVKLGEAVEKIGRLDLVLSFAEKLAAAKVVPLGEVEGTVEAPASKKGEIKGASSHVELHERAMGLIEKNPKLSYKDAIAEAVKAEPALAQ